MFQTAELERLRKRKEVLVLECDVHRRQLAEDWHRLSSADFWVQEAGAALRRHPAVTSVAAAAGGFLVSKFLRKPGGVLGTIGRVGKLASVGVSLWRLFQKQRRG